LQGNFGEGAIKNLINSNAQLNSNSFTPSQNFLAENFTLPQGEGDCTEFRSEVTQGEGDCTEFHNEVLLGEGDEPVSVTRFTKKKVPKKRYQVPFLVFYDPSKI
jgi:hypothetical protein